MNTAPNAISIRHLSLAIANQMILNDISLDIAPSEFIGVLGTNGAGKTTLFRAILGLLPPRSGTIEVLGENVRRGNSQIGYLPQARNVNERLHLNCREFLKSSWNGQKWGLPLGAGQANRAIDHVLALTGSANLASRPINELSGGERQRVLIAQSLMGNPKILILDEPLISLDPARQHDVIRLVRNIQQQMKLTVLFSAHELNPLLGSLDKVLYLGRGKAALGHVDDVVTGPVLSKLYDTEIEVLHVNGRIFVMAGVSDLEQDPHLHEHIDGHYHHDHHHHG